MGNFRNLSGQKFGHLTVLKRAENYISPCGHSRVMWVCLCDCGRTTEIAATNLTLGLSTKCNLCKDGQPNSRLKHHGETKQRIWRIWRDMRSRCENPKASQYKNYGGRGITVCDEWEDYVTFRNWALNNGYSDNLSIDRIDNNKGYCPKNCRWATRKEQQRNRSCNVVVKYKGQEKILKDWAYELNIPYSRIQARLALGWNVEDAFEKPKNYRHKENK